MRLKDIQVEINGAISERSLEEKSETCKRGQVLVVVGVCFSVWAF